MAIITISQGTFSRGRYVAKKLAKRLDYQYLSRNLLLETSEEFSVPMKRLRRAIHDAPSMLERFSSEKNHYLSLFRAVFLRHMVRDNIVYCGMAGHFLVPNIRHVCKVRVIADVESRIHKKMEDEGLTDEQARYLIHKDDDARRRWSLAIFGRDTWDSSVYDVVINIDTITIDDAVEMLAELIESGAFDGSDQSREKVKKHSILASVLADLIGAAPKVSAFIDDDVLVLQHLEGTLMGKNDRRAELRTKYLDLYPELQDVEFRGESHDNREHGNAIYTLDL